MYNRTIKRILWDIHKRYIYFKDMTDQATSQLRQTVIAYDPRHKIHCPIAGLPFKPENYVELCPEIPERAEAMWKEVCKLGLDSKCICIMSFEEANSRELTVNAEGGPPDNDNPVFQIDRVHTGEHVAEMAIQYADPASYVVDGSESAGKLAVGGVLAVTRLVCSGRADNGFAIVRPPGHHAVSGSCCVSGFCLFNNIAVAAANCRLPSFLPDCHLAVFRNVFL